MGYAWLVVYLVARVGVASLFVSSAIHKLRNLSRIGELVYELAPIFGRAAWPFGLVALITEAFIVTSVLIGGRWVLPGFLTAIALVVLYTALQLVTLIGGREVNCDCFEAPGRDPTSFSIMTVVRNLLILVVSGSGLLAFTTMGRISHFPDQNYWIYTVTIVVGLALAGALERLGRTKVDRAELAMDD